MVPAQTTWSLGTRHYDKRPPPDNCLVSPYRPEVQRRFTFFLTAILRVDPPVSSIARGVYSMHPCTRLTLEGLREEGAKKKKPPNQHRNVKGIPSVYDRQGEGPEEERTACLRPSSVRRPFCFLIKSNLHKTWGRKRKRNVDLAASLCTAAS
jgi:hypothetical protein